jgi:hypothetical protein
VFLGGNAHEDPDLQTWLADPKFHQLQEVAVGARVMITANLDIKAGVVNGSTATIMKLNMRGHTMRTKLS